MSVQRFKKSSFDAVEGALKAALNAHVTKLFEVMMMADARDQEAAYVRFKNGLRKAFSWYERVLDDIEEIKSQ